MSSVTEVAVPTSDFDGNAPVNGSRCMASTFSESLYWRRSARRYELAGLAAWMLAALSCVVFLAILLAAWMLAALMRDVEALSGDDAVFSMLRHPSVSGGDEWWNW